MPNYLGRQSKTYSYLISNSQNEQAKEKDGLVHKTTCQCRIVKDRWKGTVFITWAMVTLNCKREILPWYQGSPLSRMNKWMD